MTDLPGRIDPPQAHRAAHEYQEHRTEAQQTEMGLLATDDAMIWAEEFCRIFSGKMIALDEMSSAEHGPITPGTMVGWFANAMQTALNLYERRKLQADEEHKEAFVEGFQEGRPPA